MCGGSPDEIMRVEKVLVDVGQTPLCQGYILVVGGEHLLTLTGLPAGLLSLSLVAMNP